MEICVFIIHLPAYIYPNHLAFRKDKVKFLPIYMTVNCKVYQWYCFIYYRDIRFTSNRLGITQSISYTWYFDIQMFAQFMAPYSMVNSIKKSLDLALLVWAPEFEKCIKMM